MVHRRTYIYIMGKSRLEGEEWRSWLFAGTVAPSQRKSQGSHRTMLGNREPTTLCCWFVYLLSLFFAVFFLLSLFLSVAGEHSSQSPICCVQRARGVYVWVLGPSWVSLIVAFGNGTCILVRYNILSSNYLYD